MCTLGGQGWYPLYKILLQRSSPPLLRDFQAYSKGIGSMFFTWELGFQGFPLFKLVAPLLVYQEASASFKKAFKMFLACKLWLKSCCNAKLVNGKVGGVQGGARIANLIRASSAATLPHRGAAVVVDAYFLVFVILFFSKN